MNRLEIISRILVVIFICIWVCNYSKKEKFLPMSYNDNQMTINNSIGKVISNKKDTGKEKNCCLVKKVFDKKKKEFVYKYKKMEECSLKDLKDTNMQNILIDGVNGWNNKYCKDPELNNKNYNSDNMLGSCKNINFECKDFIPQKNCKKFNMEWTDKTCQTPYQKPFKIKPYEFNGKIL